MFFRSCNIKNCDVPIAYNIAWSILYKMTYLQFNIYITHTHTYYYIYIFVLDTS